MRVTQAYDHGCKDFIVTEYARIAQHHLMYAPELIRMHMAGVLDML